MARLSGPRRQWKPGYSVTDAALYPRHAASTPPAGSSGRSAKFDKLAAIATSPHSLTSVRNAPCRFTRQEQKIGRLVGPQLALSVHGNPPQPLHFLSFGTWRTASMSYSLKDPA